MRVLHVWNVAGVSSVLSKYLRQKGVISDVITRRVFDRSGFEGIYSNFTTSYDVSASRFYMTAVKKAAEYDVIHIHSLDKLTPLMKMRRGKPVVLHYHGTDIRGYGASLQKRIYQWFANRVLVSTSDLLEDLPSATYLPNPVDTELFHPPHKAPTPGSAMFFLKPPDSNAELDLVKVFAEERGLQLHTYSRVAGNSFPHNAMPRLYADHEYFIDCVKLSSLSRMALEALACGVKVWKADKLLTLLPQEHQPDEVVDQLLTIYHDLL